MATKRPGFRWVDKRDCLLELRFVAEGLNRYYPSKLTRRLKRIVKSDNLVEILDLEVSPEGYSNADLFRTDYLACEILSKYTKFDFGIDKKAVALEAFMCAEQACASTNLRLRGTYDTPTLGVSGDSLIETARRKIASVLGDFDWNEAFSHARFSTGASVSLRRVQGDPYHKFQAQPEITREAYPLGVAAIRSIPRWEESIVAAHGADPRKWFKFVKGNAVSLVDKNAKTDRVIAIEPSMNMFLQLGIGQVIRERLRHVKIDLNNQSHNQRYAYLGSRFGTYATLDCKQASDHVSSAIVERLLPPDWLEALRRVRSYLGVFPGGEIHRYEKFSSMGNGYTFELESLIFWALAQAVVDSYDGVERRVLVYGDDIIVPTATAGFVCELLSYCGFPLNLKKSFITGPFRESCGKHYFQGSDVTPFYVRQPIKGLHRIYWYLNSIRYWGAAGGDCCDPRASSWYRTVLSLLPRKELYMVPPSISFEGGLHASLDEAMPRWSRRSQSWHFRFIMRGVGSIQEVFDRYMYLRSQQRKVAVGEYVSLDQDFSERFTSPNDQLLVNRDRKWIKHIKTSTSSWHNAPLLCVN